MTIAASATRAPAALPGPPGVPYFGNVLQLRPARMHLQLEDWARRYGTPYRLRLIGRDMLVVADAPTIVEALRARPWTFRRARPVQSVFREMGIAGVFSAEGETWERQRRLVMRAFDPAHLKRYFPSLVTVTERLRRRWEKAAAAGEDLCRAINRKTSAEPQWLSVAGGIKKIGFKDSRGQGEKIKGWRPEAED